MAEASPPPSSLAPLFQLSSPRDISSQRRNSPARKVETPIALAPPAASIYEEPEEQPQVSQINVLENLEVPVYDDTWVTVFGFTPESSVISAVLQDFQVCGNIQMWISPPSSACNWIYVQFESKQGAQRALQRNGSTLGVLGIRVGVQPASYQDRQCIASQSRGSWTSAGVEAALPERNYALATTAAKEVKVPQLVPKSWGQRVSEVFFGA